MHLDVLISRECINLLLMSDFSPEQLRTHAVALLSVVHKSMTWGSLSPAVRKKYYDVLVRTVKSAAMTSSLGRFLDVLCARLDIPILKQDRAILDIIELKQDRAILKVLREETMLLVVMMRAKVKRKKSL